MDINKKNIKYVIARVDSVVEIKNSCVQLYKLNTSGRKRLLVQTKEIDILYIL